MTHKIVVVYQSLLGIYGDRGNAKVLLKRLQWRGEPAELVDVEPGQPLPPDGLVYLLGGGEDQAQIAAVKQLQTDRGLHAGLDAGGVLFAVCAGYQLCGRSFTVGENDEVFAGLGLLDVETRRGDQRAVGEVLSCWHRSDGGEELLTGFENHGGFTSLGSDAKPFAKVEVGVGNGTDGGAAGQRRGGCRQQRSGHRRCGAGTRDRHLPAWPDPAPQPGASRPFARAGAGTQAWAAAAS